MLCYVNDITTVTSTSRITSNTDGTAVTFHGEHWRNGHGRDEIWVTKFKIGKNIFKTKYISFEFYNLLDFQHVITTIYKKKHE